MNKNDLITSEIVIENIRCHIYNIEDNNSINKIIYWIEDYMTKAPQVLQTLTKVKNYVLIGISITDWNRYLSPWYCPKLFGKEDNDFKGQGQVTFDWLINNCIPIIEKEFISSKDNITIKRYIGGYSLAALFSLWVFYSDINKKAKIFDGVCACSPSLWYIKWEEYLKDKEANDNSIIYLSLGDKEGKTKNKVFQKMKTGMDNMIEKIKNDKNVKKYIFEENKGGHYTDIDLRMAKGFKWIIEN
jgi:predicted alpha/beta superfamily hydrolase